MTSQQADNTTASSSPAPVQQTAAQQELMPEPQQMLQQISQQQAAPITAGQCWVYAPIKPRPINERVEVVLKESAVRIDVQPAEIEKRQQRIVTREGVKTYRIAPATFKQVTERVMVKPEIPRFVVVPARYEQREAMLVVEEARTVLEPCRTAGTRYAPETGAMAFCAREIPAKEEIVKVEVLVEPETTRVEYEPAQYETVTRWVVDQPARVIEVMTDSEEASIAVSEVVQPERTSQRVEPALKRDVDITRFEGEPQIVARRALCDHDITRDFISDLQHVLATKGYDAGEVDGLLGKRTVEALTRFQVEHGLAAGALTYESLKELGIK